MQGRRSQKGRGYAALPQWPRLLQKQMCLQDRELYRANVFCPSVVDCKSSAIKMLRKIIIKHLQTGAGVINYVVFFYVILKLALNFDRKSNKFCFMQQSQNDSQNKDLSNRKKDEHYENDSAKIVRRHLEDKNHVISEEEIRNVRISTEIPPFNEVTTGAEAATLVKEVEKEKPADRPATSWDTIED